jgi:hypothetical protein
MPPHLLRRFRPVPGPAWPLVLLVVAAVVQVAVAVLR